MAHTPHDEPQKVLLVPESLYDAVSEYVAHLRRRRLYAVDKPTSDGGANDAFGAESSENHRSGRSTPGGWTPMTPPKPPITGTASTGLSGSGSSTADYDEGLEPDGADEPTGNTR